MHDILFLLGAGVSVDSGLFTYRGLNSLNIESIDDNSSFHKIWEHTRIFYNYIIQAKKGETYIVLDTLISLYPNSTILTQNVDGLIFNLSSLEKYKVGTYELHGNTLQCKCVKCCIVYDIKDHIDENVPSCKSCDNLLLPNIILMGQNLDNKVMMEVNKRSKRKYKYVLVIGSTLTFPYLRSLINNAKCRGAKVIHINLDENYGNKEIKEKYMSFAGLKKYKTESKVRKGEVFYNMSAAEGIRKFMDDREKGLV